MELTRYMAGYSWDGEEVECIWLENQKTLNISKLFIWFRKWLDANN